MKYPVVRKKRQTMRRVMSFALVVVMLLAAIPLHANAYYIYGYADNDILLVNWLIRNNDSMEAQYNVNDPENWDFCEWDNETWKSMTSLIIPDGVTQLREGADSHSADGHFSCCLSLKTVVVPDSVEAIPGSCFIASKTIEHLDLGNGITEIGDWAFASCTKLKEITIPDSVVSIGSNAFRETSLETITLGDGLVDIYQQNVFFNCDYLETIHFGKNLKSFDSLLISNCPNLTTITFCDNVDNIYNGYQPFENCPNITIHGYSNSVVESFAKECGYPFVSLGMSSKPDPNATPSPVPVPDFDPNDAPSTWATEQVRSAIAANLVPRTLQTQYTQAITRAEFCSLAVALYEQATGKEITGRTTFVDSADVNVEKAAAIGVVKGIDDDRFAPNDGLTREQAATMLARLAEAVGKPLSPKEAIFADRTSIADWAIDSVGQVQAAEIMSGDGNNTFDPKGAYTREQSILTILRLYNLVVAIV